MFQFTQPKRAATRRWGWSFIRCYGFNSRSPSGLRLQMVGLRLRTRRSFNSRSPSGLRLCGRGFIVLLMCFNSRSPSGLRQLDRHEREQQQLVSIHAAQAGCDPMSITEQILYARFQFTQPKRAATVGNFEDIDFTSVSIHAAQAGCDPWQVKGRELYAVSIHAAQAGCDLSCLQSIGFPSGFNSRSPSGLRQGSFASSLTPCGFQFTQPKRAATVAAKIQQKRYSLKG